jgi:MFS family permease
MDVFIVLNIGTAILGFGVGGEYPLASTSATERSGENSHEHKRGRTVGMTFAMQGWGTFTNTLILFVIVAANGTSSCVPGLDSPYKNDTGHDCAVERLDWSWRGSYLFGIFAVGGVVVYRMCYLGESAVWARRQEDLKRSDPAIVKRHKALILKVVRRDSIYATRLFATSLCWFGELKMKQMESCGS